LPIFRNDGPTLLERQLRKFVNLAAITFDNLIERQEYCVGHVSAAAGGSGLRSPRLMPKSYRCNAWRAHFFGPTIRLKYRDFNPTRSHRWRVDPGEAFLRAIEGIGIGWHRRARLIQALDLLGRQAPADRADIVAQLHFVAGADDD
jgi:hypothetical protein